MGGSGSGRRWHPGSAPCTDDFHPLDVRRLAREGLLSEGRTFGWHWRINGREVASIQIRVREGHVLLDYRHRPRDGTWRDECYPVRLEYTPCRYGGERVWFRCPEAGCGRRVAILYGGARFACRKCHGLAYPSQREPVEDAAARRADKIRRKLGWQAGILNGTGEKPKGMWSRTYWRLVMAHDEHVHASLNGIARRLGMQGLGDD